MSQVEEILLFWFGTGTDDLVTASRQKSLWWEKNAQNDVLIRTRFEALVLAADAGRLEDWRATPDGLLALILLTDQFPRNMYRDKPDAFRFDARARKYCLEALDTAVDTRLRPIQRIFLYLPLEHSETLAHQERCLSLMNALAQEVPATWRTSFEGYAAFAERHREIIERFGRFPHRNALLGRPSTAEELQFLQQPGSSF
jgi:uncharacterized protein (DUF924 family)